MVAADGTVAFSSAWQALVRGCVGNGDADIAALAVVEVFAQAFASPANTAVWAMINLLFAVVIPELANVTIIACSLCITVDADVTRFLGCSAQHT